MPAVWQLTMDGSADTLVFNADGTVTFGDETRSLAGITEIRILGSAGDDVLTLDRRAADAAITVVFDGADGFDTLVTVGAGSLVSLPADGSSGILHLGATTVVYSHIEPITNVGTATDVVFTLSGNDDQAVLESIVGGLRLRSTNGSFEQTDFTGPTISLTINGGDGHDTITILGTIALAGANLVINVEEITVNGAISTTGDVTLKAAETTTEGLNAADCTDFDDFSIIGCLDHDADVSIVIDGGSITAHDVVLDADATVIPDATAATAYAAIVNSTATIELRGAATITATGDVTMTADSIVGPFTLNKQYGDAAIVFSDATVTVGGSSVVTAGGDVALTATSTVDAGATPQADAGKDEGSAGADGSSPSFDAAVAVVTVTSTTKSLVAGTARLAVTGGLGIAASNHATLTGVGDAKEATAGAGVAIVHLDQTTEAGITSTSATPTTAATLSILAEQEASVTATSKAGKGGATQNNQNANSPGRGNGQSSTSDGSIDIAGALSVAVLTTDTKAHITGAKVTTTGAQSVKATAKNAVATTADAGTADGTTQGSNGFGLAIGVAINVIDVATASFIGAGAALQAASVAVDAQGPATGDSSFAATSVSGRKNSGSVGIAGSLALNAVTADTAAEVRGTGNSLNNANLALSARGSHTNAAKATSKQDGGSVGVGASVAISLINVAVRAGLAAASAITGVKALNIAATGLDDTTTETQGGAGGGSTASLTGVASIAISNVRTVASILAGPALTTSGAITAKADQTAKATTTATGATTAGSGASLAATISFALTSADHEADSSIFRNVTSGGAVSMAADGVSTTATSATASAAAAPDENSDSTGKNANQKSDAKLGNASSRSSGGGASTTPAAKNEDGTAVTVAAAIAFNLVDSTTTARLGDGVVLVATGPASFTTRNNTDASATADGSSTGATSVGVGAGLAVNRVTLRNEASTGVGSALTANGLTLSATVKPVASDSTHTFEAIAKAGATDGSGTLGIAGAFALNLVDATTLGVIHGSQAPGPAPSPTPGVVITGSGAVTLIAGSKTVDKASGKATQSGTGTVGIGAAFALNLVTHTVYAGIDQVLDPTRGPPLTAAGALTITATEDLTLTTEAEAGGASGSVTVVPAIAITLATVRTSASLGGSTTALTASSVTAQTTQGVKAGTTAKGDTQAGSTAGIGVSLALAVLDSVVVDSGSARSITATGAVTFGATQAVDVTTLAEASAKGASPSEGKDGGGKDVNQKADANLGNANQSRNTNGGQTQSSSTPKAASNEDGGNSLSIAGAIAINVVVTTSRAWFGNGVVIASGGVVTLKSLANTDVSANAKGDSATDGSVGIGAGVAVNSVGIVNRAVTGTATITGTGLVLTAGLAGGDTNDVIRRWTGTEWKIVDEGKELPGPSKDDLAYVKTNGGTGGNDGIYKFTGSDWTIETDTTIASGAAMPGSPSSGDYFLLTTARDGKPAQSVWKYDGSAWQWITADVYNEKAELPKDKTAEGDWFRLTAQDGTKAPGFYKRNGSHEWILQAGATVTDGAHFPASPTADQLFRLWEHEVAATARAGASKSTSVGVAGALAINILDNTTEALLQSGAAATLTSGAVSISAHSNERDLAKATSKAEVGSATGVGASVALQVIDGSDVRAEAANGAALTGGSSLTIDAFGFRELLTTAEGGTEGGTAVTPVVALVVSVDDDVTARLGTSGTAYVGSGPVTVTATHVNRVVTEGNADAAGKSTAVGADLSINVVVDWDTLAEIARNTTGTVVAVLAVSDLRTEAKAIASAKGADESDSSGDQKSNEQVNGSNPNTQGTSSSTGSMPSSNGGTNGSNGASGASSQSSSQSGTGSGTTAVAAAVAVNWTVAVSTARIAANAHVTATTGAVTVRSTLWAHAKALAMGSAIDLESSGTRVGAAVGLNVQDLTNRASIGTDAVVSGHAGVVVEAATPSVGGVPQRNEFIVWGFAAGGGKSTSFAGSAAVQILLLTTEARVGQGAELDAPAGGITVHADQLMGLQNLAIAGALSTGNDAAIGAAFSVNFLEITTTAAIESATGAGSVTKADASGGISVTAKSTLDSLVPEVPAPLDGKIDWLKLTSVAIAGGASSGGAAVSGAFIIEIFDFDTQAWIGNGAQVNQEGAIGGGSQSVTVRAEDDLTVDDVGGTLSLSQSSASVGITVIVVVANSDVRAFIGDSADVRAGGSVTVDAGATEDWFLLAIAGGVSLNSVAVTGAVIVFVVDQGGSGFGVIDLIVWRVIGGVGIGIASVVSPAYIAEISPRLLRGRL
ncbi:beta strand repeat-containing protein, partial [Agromyces humi]|uniref:beta strand repeat-containing protein n=1 Tax=Agromyces humi TaxID=1766800 RepID=UPI00135B7A1F